MKRLFAAAALAAVISAAVPSSVASASLGAPSGASGNAGRSSACVVSTVGKHARTCPSTYWFPWLP